MRGVWAACLVVAVACSSSSGGSTASQGQMGASCTCPGATDAGNSLCAGKMYTTCAASLYCVDGACTELCQLEAGTCPSGYVCRQSSGVTYCAHQ